jgi:hypothetical protein
MGLIVDKRVSLCLLRSTNKHFALFAILVVSGNIDNLARARLFKTWPFSGKLCYVTYVSGLSLATVPIAVLVLGLITGQIQGKTGCGPWIDNLGLAKRPPRYILLKRAIDMEALKRRLNEN